MKHLTLTSEQARQYVLAHQGLWPPYSLVGKQGILDHVFRVGCIQYDPLDVVGRNPDLVLQSRVLDYSPELLRELLYEDRRLIDGLDKMMAIYPVEDWPCFQRYRDAAVSRLEKASSPVFSVVGQVREAIRDRGPLWSGDLDHEQRIAWPWGPTRLSRAALESMYLWGELIVHHKVNTRKIYDYAARHIPADLLSAPDPNPTEEQYRDWHVLRRIGGIGLLWERSGDVWLGIHGVKAKERGQAIDRLLDDGKIMKVSVDGIDSPLYMRTSDEPTLDRVLHSGSPAPRAALIAPLDNLLWDRRLVKELFGFDYRWEVYKPVADRKYGYYVLPVLYGDRFIARVEPQYEKRSRTLVVKNWWWEPGAEPTQQVLDDLADCFRRFLDYLGAGELRVDCDVSIPADVPMPAPVLFTNPAHGS